MSAPIEISWAKGSKMRSRPEDAYDVLQGIIERDGHVTAEAIVQAAKPKKSPIHDDFNWNDKEAAHQFRLTQARKMARSLLVRHPEMPKQETRALETTTIPATDDSPPRKVYDNTRTLLENKATRDELLARAIREALAFRKRYHALSELAKVFAAIDTLLENADDLLKTG